MLSALRVAWEGLEQLGPSEAVGFWLGEALSAESDCFKIFPSTSLRTFMAFMLYLKQPNHQTRLYFLSDILSKILKDVFFIV